MVASEQKATLTGCQFYAYDQIDDSHPLSRTSGQRTNQKTQMANDDRFPFAFNGWCLLWPVYSRPRQTVHDLLGSDGGELLQGIEHS